MFSGSIRIDKIFIAFWVVTIAINMENWSVKQDAMTLDCILFYNNNNNNNKQICIVPLGRNFSNLHKPCYIVRTMTVFENSCLQTEWVLVNLLKELLGLFIQAHGHHKPTNCVSCLNSNTHVLHV